MTNNDGTFNNTTELVWTSTTSGYNNTATIAVPVGQISGIFRMRIRSKQNCPFVISDEACTYNNPNGSNCPNAGYNPGQSGPYWFADEIEDYSVKIIGGAGAGGAGVTYSWAPPTGLSATNIPNPNAAPSQTTTYTLTVTDVANNCFATQTVTVTVAGVIDVNYTVGACANDLYNITGTITTPATPTTGSLVVEDCNGTIITIATAPFNGTSFPFNLTGLSADGNNCSLEIYFTAANCPETVSFSAPAPCSGCLNPFTFTSTSTNTNCGNNDGSITLAIASGGLAPFSYSIDNGTTTQATGSFTGLSAGVYTIVITDDQGCTETSQITLTNSISTDASFTFASFCEGSVNAPTNVMTAGGIFSFNPIVTDGATINPTTGTITNGIGGTTYFVEYAIVGNCPSSTTQQVVVNPNPIPVFTADKKAGCAPLTVNFSSNTSGVNCLWTFGDGTTSTTCNTVSHTYSSTGIYTVNLTVTNANGCIGTHTEIGYINVSPTPNASFTVNPYNPTTSNPLVNFTNTSTNSTTFKWNFGDDSGNSYETHPSHTYQSDEEGAYFVTLIAYNGTICSDTARITIQVEEELVIYVPNVFTPDSDEYNPIFKPVFASGYDPSYYDLYVFDRWGEMLFESHDIDLGWDGTYLGKIVSDNTYIWKIEIKERKSDKKHAFNGHVTIVR